MHLFAIVANNAYLCMVVFIIFRIMCTRDFISNKDWITFVIRNQSQSLYLINIRPFVAKICEKIELIAHNYCNFYLFCKKNSLQ